MNENSEDNGLDRFPRVSGQDGMVSDMATCMDKFARTFEASSRRWELIVYPSLIAFIILAAYGFYLIYTLTNDVNRLASSMETIVGSMNDVVTHMHVVSANVSVMSGNLGQISADVSDKSDSMLVNIERLNNSLNAMTVPMVQIRQDMVHMNHSMHNVAGPMRVMNSVFPF